MKYRDFQPNSEILMIKGDCFFIVESMFHLITMGILNIIKLKDHEVRDGFNLSLLIQRRDQRGGSGSIAANVFKTWGRACVFVRALHMPSMKFIIVCFCPL